MKTLIIVLILISTTLFAQVNNPQVIDNGGGKANALNVKNYASIGQSVVGVTSGANTVVHSGFINAYEIEFTYVEDPYTPVPLPEKISLSLPYPNPFNSTCHFDITVPEATELTFEVYNTLGHRVYSQTEFYKGGLYHFTFEAGNLPTGVYLYRVQTATEKHNGKFILAK